MKMPKELIKEYVKKREVYKHNQHHGKHQIHVRRCIE